MFIQLPGEMVVMDVPAVYSGDRRPFVYDVHQTPVNMTYDPGPKPKAAPPSATPVSPLEPKGYPVNMTYDPGPK